MPGDREDDRYFAAEEAACKRESSCHDLPRRDHPFEGMSHPTPEVNGMFAEFLLRIVVDMTRDLMDVQFYTGEYASKKFEVARDMLPELFQGLHRSQQQFEEEEEEEKAAKAAVSGEVEGIADVVVDPCLKNPEILYLLKVSFDFLPWDSSLSNHHLGEYSWNFFQASPQT